jgi:hypothetical protein
MQLRHIRPRSVEWYDALMEEERAIDRLEPEEALKLRSLFALDRLDRRPQRAANENAPPLLRSAG